MNDLLSNSFSRLKPDQVSPPQPAGIQMSAMGANLDKFFEDVEGIKDELKEIESLHKHLQQSHEQLKTIHNAKSIKDHRSLMDSDISSALKKTKFIKVRLEVLDRSNASNRTLPGCGPGSSSDRTRISVLNGLRKKLKDSMDGFNSLRQEINSEYKETVKRRFFTVTGESADERTVEILIETGNSESLVQKAIQEQGRGNVVDTISEIHERFDVVRDMEKSLMELHQVFLDMAVLVEVQGEQLDDIESHIRRANSFVTKGADQLQVARDNQTSSRKWMCIGIVVLILLVLIIVLPIVLRNTGKDEIPSPNPPANPNPSG